jgi:hypothetical protein
MREIYYNSDITSKAMNEIKLLSLYYDKINIVNDAVYSPKFETIDGKFQFVESEELQFIPKSFYKEYKLLLDEKLISITKREEQESDYEKQFNKKASELVNANFDLIFPLHPTEKDGRIVTEEVYNIMKQMTGFEWGKPIEQDFIWWYYSFKLKWFLKLLIEGKKCISSSNNLNVLFGSFIKETNKLNNDLNVSCFAKSFALDALKISLPNPDILSFEDILELKFRLKDELELFSKTMNSIEIMNEELLKNNLSDNTYQGIFYKEIEQPFQDLKNKMKNLKSQTFRKFIEKMGNPANYAPLIGTFLASLSIQYTLLASFGLIGTTSYLEYKEEKRNITNNGFYYLLKLSN